MELTKNIKNGAQIIWAHPYIWALALIAVLGDLWAILDYNPNSPNFSDLIIWVGILTFFAETSVLSALILHAQSTPCSFIDAIMTSISSLSAFGAKAVMMVIPSLFLVLFVILSTPLHVIFDDILFPILFTILLVPLLVMMQIWTPFTTCGIIVQQYSMSEAMTHALRIIWRKKKTLFQIALLILIIDAGLIFILYWTGGISFESAFIYTVTEEMAKNNVQFMTGSPAEAGEYFAINRPIAGLLATVLKTRGVDLLSITTYIINKKLIGLATVVVAMAALLVRISVLTSAYHEWAEPTHDFSKDEISFWKEQKYFKNTKNEEG